MTSVFSNLFKFSGHVQKMLGLGSFPNFASTIVGSGLSPAAIQHNPWSTNSVRTMIRNNFPRAREKKRVKKMGWLAHLKTKNGRRVIMRRILKGRFYITH